MNHTQRQTIQEVVDACRTHEKTTARVEGLEDVHEGLAISATKLDTLLSTDEDNPQLGKKAITLLIEAHATSKKVVTEARQQVRKFADQPYGSLKWDHAGTLAR